MAGGTVAGGRSHVCTMLSAPSLHRASLLHKKAISAVHNQLCSHDVDPRYTDATVKAKVAELYLPLLSLARDTLPRLHGFAGQRAGGDGVSWARDWIMDVGWENQKTQWLASGRGSSALGS